MSINSISPELHLYYSLDITPFDEEAIHYKKSIDLAKVCKEHKVLKNNEVKEFYHKKGIFCPIANEKFIETCYVE